MARYIDAEALKDWSEIVPLTGDGGIDINDFDEKLASMPAADVAPVRRGRWETKDGWDGDEYYACSSCGAEFVLIDGTPSDNDYNYCPNCGAKMDGGDGDA